MSVKSVCLKNFLVFHKELTIDFSEGINVIIGENGVGKTSLLKCIYAAGQCSVHHNGIEPMARTAHFFSPNTSIETLKFNNDEGMFSVSDGKKEFVFKFNLDNTISVGSNKYFEVKQSVFIPTTEMLSHSKGFLALNQKYKLPFDGTQIDIIINASLPETREIPKEMDIILKKISQVIDGTVVMENDIFYVIKSDGKKIEFSLEAEGLRKLGLMWKLIRNGLLESGSVLLWDEPEANLNPELYPLIADILHELQKNGVQIFVATHSYNFAKYLEIKTHDEIPAQFCTLYKDDNGDIKADISYALDDSQNNPMITAENELLDAVLD